MNELWKGFACLLKSEKDLNISVESVSVDFNEGKAEEKLVRKHEISVK